MSKKKNWLMIKRGLSEDPKHRESMGNRVWVYMHILDRADWEAGVVYDWRDKDEAADMGMPWKTLQRQRQELAEQGYITCKQTLHGQDIIIHRWVNPRNYSGEVLNIGSEGYAKMSMGGTHHVTSKVSTLPIVDQVSSFKEKKFPELSPDCKAILEAYVALLPNGDPADADGVEFESAKWLAEKGYTPAQLKETYDTMKAESFWRGKRIKLKHLQARVPDYVRDTNPVDTRNLRSIV